MPPGDMGNPRRGRNVGLGVVRNHLWIVLCVVLVAALTSCAAMVVEPLELPNPGDAVYVIGDSWSTGYSATEGHGYPDLLAKDTGWVLTVNAQSGTGYTANLNGDGETFENRVTDLPAATPGMLIVQGGLNDEWAAWQNVGEDARVVLTELADRYPDAPIVVVGPATAKWPATEVLHSIDKQLGDAAAAAGAWYVSPISDGWVTEENVSEFIDPATKHPSTEGHAIFASRLLRELGELSGQP